MVFSDLTFLYIFLPLFFICYSLFNKNAIIIIFSIIFYAWGEPIYVFLLLFSILINYLIGLYIYNNKPVLILGLIFNIGLLFVFKYANLFYEIFGTLTNNQYMINNKLNIHLPIGISFYTFQSISYIVDVYRGKAEAQKNFFKILLYISMFPQLIMGPIVRYNTINKQIDKRTSSIDSIFNGAVKIIFGLAKKVILADELKLIVDYFLINNFDELTFLGGLIGIICFSLELYFDFSGYTDIAIGLGKILGFDFEENFNFPYISRSMSEFFRRWHISLSSFFKEYVYIPLGGNRKHVYLNIFIVWFLTGIWHGAVLNYFLWGLFLATIICVEKFVFDKFHIKDNIFLNIISHIYLILMTLISWSIFYFEDLNKLSIFFKKMLNPISFTDLVTSTYVYNNLIIIIVGIICAMPINNLLLIVEKQIIKFEKVGNVFNNLIITIVAIVLLIVSTLFIISNTNSPFLYTRF